MACQPDSGVGVHVCDIIVEVLYIDDMSDDTCRNRTDRFQKRENVRCRPWRKHFQIQERLPSTSDRIYSHQRNNRKPGSKKNLRVHNSTKIRDCPAAKKKSIPSVTCRLNQLFCHEFVSHVEFIILCSRSTRSQNSSRSALDRYNDRLVLLICKLLVPHQHTPLSLSLPNMSSK